MRILILGELWKGTYLGDCWQWCLLGLRSASLWDLWLLLCYLLLFAYLDLLTQIVWFCLDLVSGLCKDENVGIVIFNKHTRVWCGSIHWVSRYGPEYLRLKVLINAPPIQVNEGKKG